MRPAEKWAPIRYGSQLQIRQKGGLQQQPHPVRPPSNRHLTQTRECAQPAHQRCERLTMNPLRIHPQPCPPSSTCPNFPSAGGKAKICMVRCQSLRPRAARWTIFNWASACSVGQHGRVVRHRTGAIHEVKNSQTWTSGDEGITPKVESYQTGFPSSRLLGQAKAGPVRRIPSIVCSVAGTLAQVAYVHGFVHEMACPRYRRC